MTEQSHHRKGYYYVDDHDVLAVQDQLQKWIESVGQNDRQDPEGHPLFSVLLSEEGSQKRKHPAGQEEERWKKDQEKHLMSFD